MNSDEFDALSGADWMALSTGVYNEPIAARHAKWLHRALVDHTLGGRRLVSREMLSEVRKVNESIRKARCQYRSRGNVA